MDQPPPSIAPDDAEARGRAVRHAREAEMIAEARAELARGEGISGDELQAFMGAFVRGEPLPAVAAKR